MCERLIRTLFQIISKYMTHHNTKRFINKLGDFEFIYNNSYHRSIKRTPASVNSSTWWKTYEAQYGIPVPHKNPKLQSGDKVLRVKDKPVFTKGYSQTFGKEPFTIVEVKKSNPPTYIIASDDDGKLRRSFYERELIKIS